jgi:hypothetical protein
VAIVEIIAMAALSFQGQPRDAANFIAASEIIGLQHRRHENSNCDHLNRRPLSNKRQNKHEDYGANRSGTKIARRAGVFRILSSPSPFRLDSIQWGPRAPIASPLRHQIDRRSDCDESNDACGQYPVVPLRFGR